MWLGHSLSFWLAIAGAITVKIITSETHSLKRAITTIIVAVFFAWAFTDAVIAWLEIKPDIYKTPTAALLALTGEGLARMLLSIKSFDDLVNIWRGVRGKNASEN